MENQINTGEQSPPQVSQNSVSQPVITPEKPKINYLTMGGVALVCSLIFGFSGYYLGKQSLNPQQSTNNIVNNSPTPVISAMPSQSSVPNPNLKSYTDPLNTFTFNYPNNFVTQGGIYQGGYDNKELLITLQVAGTESYRPSNQLSIATRKTSGLDTFLEDIYALKIGETWSNPNFAPKYTRVTDSTIAGIIARNYSQSGDSEEQDRMTILNKNGKYYVFMYGSKNPSNLQQNSVEYGVDFSNAFTEVFSSFKFL